MYKIITAYDNNKLIGGNNKLVWHIKEDLEHFYKEIGNDPLIMGRKTYESIVEWNLKNKIFVLTRNINYKTKSETHLVFNDINELINKTKNMENVFVCGGSQIYKEFLNYSGELIITKIDDIYEGDSYFPNWNEKLFELTYTTKLNQKARVEYYKRKQLIN